MQKEFSKEYMIANKGCYDTPQLMLCSFMKSDIITLDAILASEITLERKYQFVCQNLLTTDQKLQIAIAISKMLVPVYLETYPRQFSTLYALDLIDEYMAGKKTISQLQFNPTPVTSWAYMCMWYTYDAVVHPDSTSRYATEAIDLGIRCAREYPTDIYRNKLFLFLIDFVAQN